MRYSETILEEVSLRKEEQGQGKYPLEITKMANAQSKCRGVVYVIPYFKKGKLTCQSSLLVKNPLKGRKPYRETIRDLCHDKLTIHRISLLFLTTNDPSTV